MKKFITLALISSLVAASSAKAEEFNIGWNPADANNAFTPSYTGKVLSVIKDSSLTFTVDTLAANISDYAFSIYTYDASNNLTIQTFDSLSVGDVFSVNFNAGDSIDFWLTSDGTVTGLHNGMTGYLNIMPGGDEATASFHLDNGDFSSYWNTVISFTPGGSVPTPGGQPMPGVLASALLGAGALGIYLRKKHK